jgi:hypothetical protein
VIEVEYRQRFDEEWCLIIQPDISDQEALRRIGGNIKI